MKISNDFPSRAERAFSLVEVTIAMAIAAVALVTLIGMIPQGMNTMREAGDTAIEARIHQQILNELQMVDFDTIHDEYHELIVYYDGQGEELGDSKGTGLGDAAEGMFEHIYSARISVPNPGDTLPPTVGGGNFDGIGFGDGTVNSEIRLVVIEVAAVGGRGDGFDWDLEDNEALISSYQTSVVKMGK
ncbi:MAG: Verru_Chthon cassette protein B [Verrucomicrobiales bacterium]|nr:Verru_Chthon cassette protein B [Verrucomicrobiales bacterium]